MRINWRKYIALWQETYSFSLAITTCETLILVYLCNKISMTCSLYSVWLVVIGLCLYTVDNHLAFMKLQTYSTAKLKCLKAIQGDIKIFLIVAKIKPRIISLTGYLSYGIRFCTDNTIYFRDIISIFSYFIIIPEWNFLTL